MSEDPRVSAPALVTPPVPSQLASLFGMGPKGVLGRFHQAIEGWPLAFTALSAVAVSVGG